MDVVVVVDVGAVEGAVVERDDTTPTVTSSKKHFMKNVKECRDVNRRKASHTLWTHTTLRIVRVL